ncbi:MAG TPA: hypothetical protein VFE13_16590 [Caulobacteraceae bacterium]|nr:hypothetical protein [Caulobacteraceae bacterium]
MWKPRPYDPAFAERLVELASDGLFRAEIATELGASLDDFATWATLHPEFAIALADADRATRAWWDRQAREAMSSGKSFRSALWAKVMAQNYGRAGHLPRGSTDRPVAKPVVLARYEIPDNGKERRPRRARGKT